jgi:hypothetical protein
MYFQDKPYAAERLLIGYLPSSTAHRCFQSEHQANDRGPVTFHIPCYPHPVTAATAFQFR